ncbi:50S ribosomal protein L25 [Candidatus Parcubacteria bacterium]|nr:50S ribosomal protein L25 [Candidatus Parcubacteria bacterium]
MSKIKFDAQVRVKDEKMFKLRSSGLVPAILYGPKIKNIDLKIKRNDFEKLLKQAGYSTLIELVIDKKNTETVLIKNVQREGVHDQVLHIDFFKPSDKKKIIVKVPLEFIGTSKTVKEMGGIQLINMEMIKMRVLAKDLLSKITVDLSKIESFSDSIRVRDLKLSDTIEVLDNPNNVIASTALPKVASEEVKGKEEKTEDKKEEEKTEKSTDKK